MRPLRAAVVLCLTVFPLAGCQAYKFAFVNDAGRPVSLKVVYRDGVPLTGTLPSGRALVMLRAATEIDHVSYEYGDARCRLDGEALRPEPAQPHRLPIVSLAECGTTGPAHD